MRALLIAAVALLALPGSAGAKLTYRDAAGKVVVARDDGSSPKVLAARGFLPTLSPNGRRVAYLTPGPCKCAARTLHVSDADGRNDRVLARKVYRPGFLRLPLPWAPDSRHIAVSGYYRFGGYLVDAKTRRSSFVRSEFRFDGATFSPSSRRMIYADSGGTCENGRIVLFSLRERRRTSLGCGEGAVWGPKAFAFLRDGWVYAARRPGSKPRRLIEQGDAATVPVAWSADGERLLLAQASRTETTSHALIVDRTTGAAQTLGPAFTNITAISRDGHTVLGVSGGDVVAADDDGTTSVIAKNASSPSWNR
jgi:hypothetical protein